MFSFLKDLIDSLASITVKIVYEQALIKPLREYLSGVRISGVFITFGVGDIKKIKALNFTNTYATNFFFSMYTKEFLALVYVKLDT